MIRSMSYSTMTNVVKKLNNFLKGVAVLMILVSIVTPFAYQMTQVFAQDYAVEMHIQYKDGTKQSLFRTEEALLDEPLPEIQAAGEMPEIETVFTPEQYEEIEEKQGVIYDRYLVASVDENKLKELGYTSEQIADIAKMVEWYNSFKVLSVQIINLKAQREAKKVSFGVTASAAPCEPDLEYRWELWGYEVIADNECDTNELKFNYNIYAAALGATAFTPCSVACGILAGYQAVLVPAIEYQAGRCDNGGVIVRVYFGAAWQAFPNC